MNKIERRLRKWFLIPMTTMEKQLYRKAQKNGYRYSIGAWRACVIWQFENQLDEHKLCASHGKAPSFKTRVFSGAYNVKAKNNNTRPK